MRVDDTRARSRAPGTTPTPGVRVAACAPVVRSGERARFGFNSNRTKPRAERFGTPPLGAAVAIAAIHRTLRHTARSRALFTERFHGLTPLVRVDPQTPRIPRRAARSAERAAGPTASLASAPTGPGRRVRS